MNIIKLNSRGEDVKLLQKKLNLISDGIFGKLTEEAVKKFQEDNGLIPDGIVGKNTWDKLGVSNKRNIKEIIVHCTATPEGKNFNVDDVRRMHIQERGWSDIGYHYLVYLDGSIHKGRDESKVGAHCTNHNSISIGVCYVGGLEKGTMKPKDTRTQEQKTSLRELIKSLKIKYPQATIHGHREFANKACPCFDAKKEYSDL